MKFISNQKKYKLNILVVAITVRLDFKNPTLWYFDETQLKQKYKKISKIWKKKKWKKYGKILARRKWK